MSLNMTTFAPALKQLYPRDKVLNLVYKDNPWMALCPKMESFYGANLVIALIYGNPQGRSQDFTQAQARGQVTSSLLQRFTLVRVHDYSIATIDNETLLASENDEGALLSAASTEIDGAIQSLSRSIAVQMYRTGFGGIGVIGAGTTGSSIVLTNAADITNFEVGMVLVDSAVENTGALANAGASVTIQTINRDAGTMTVSANTFAADIGYTLFVKGDRQDTANPVALMTSGLKAWIPATAPTSTLFFGVDRSVDVTRLGGQRFDGRNLPIEEALVRAAALVAREGGKLDHYFMDYEKYSDLENSLGAKVQYIDLLAPAQVAFRGIVINGPRGPIKIVPDQNCPQGAVFGLQLDTWKLYTLGDAVRVVEADGLPLLRQTNADGVEVRYAYYGNLGCRGPGYNVQVLV